jgi:hypothetical protein
MRRQVHRRSDQSRLDVRIGAPALADPGFTARVVRAIQPG